MKVLRISARTAGFRRAGIAHPTGPVDHPVDRFTDEERAALLSEPQLVVEEVEVADPTEDGAPAEKDGGDGAKGAGKPKASGGK